MNELPIKILLIEDNPGDAHLIQIMLSEVKNTNRNITCIERLSAGLDYIANKKIDVILLDLGLPDSQGLDTLRQVCKKAPSLPIVVLTGLDDEQLAMQAVSEGAQDYLVKGEITGKALWRVIRYSIERIQTEKVLLLSEQRFKEAQALGKIGNWELDLATQQIGWSDQVYELYERDKNLGTPSVEEEALYYTQEETRRLREYARLATQEGKGFEYELTAKLPSGKTAFFNASMHPIKDDKGHVIKLFGTVQDITERKKMEEQMLTNAKLASIGELAAGVAHEINNPLTIVIGYAQLLSDREDVPEDIKQDLDRIYQSSQRVVRIVQSLLRFAHRYEPEKTLVNINELIENTLELRSYELRTSNVDLEVKLAPDLPLITADYNQMQQVLLNILMNAEHAIAETKHTGKIIIETSTANNSVKIAITDNGPGITREIIPKIFDPFFTTKPVGSGSGLGLSVCHGIITEHGGTLSALSEGGAGATFVIELPVPAEMPSVNGKEAVEMAPAKPTRTITGTILIIDDEPLIHDLLRRTLEAEGHKVDDAFGAQEVQAKVTDTSYDLLLLDIKMPGMSGEELYTILKKEYPHLAEKVIFITGDTLTEETTAFLDSSGRPYLSKPFDSMIVKAAVRKALAGR